MRLARLLSTTLVAAGCLLLAERDAHAGGPVTVGVGYMATFGGNFLDKPTEKKYLINGTRQAVDPSYPGFGGTTGGFLGFALDVRYMSLIGLEIDVFKATNNGKADMTITNLTTGRKLDYVLEIGHEAWHIPVLLKGSIPSPLISPYLVIGAEFVRPDGEFATTDINTGGLYKARTENYTYFTAGVGFEFKLPIAGLPEPINSIRIPFSLRGSYYGIGENLEDRAEYNFAANTITYDTRWKYQALATLGIQIYFL